MAEIGELVRVDFIGRLDDGAEFSNSYLAGEPFEFVLGEHKMLPAFENAVFELNPGESTKLRVPAEHAYGPYDESLVEAVPIEGIPHAAQLPVGKYVVFATPQGDVRVKVLKVEGGMVYFDHNHELAGEDLTFDIKLVEVVHDSALDRERHPEGCACGCDVLKKALRDR